MRIKPNFKPGANVTLGKGGETAKVDRWGVAHKAISARGGRINVSDDPITSLPQGEVYERADGKSVVDLRDVIDATDMQVSLPNNRVGLVEVSERAQYRSWGKGEHYYLALDGTGATVVEPGRRHRKIYVSGSPAAMDKAAIAADAGVSVGTVTGAWLVNHPEYGGSESMPLTETVAIELFVKLHGGNYGRYDDLSRSDWVLFERGYEYSEYPGRAYLIRGESEIHPIYFGAWGSGAAPIITTSHGTAKTGPRYLVTQGLNMMGAKAQNSFCQIIEDYVIYKHEGGGDETASITWRRGQHLECWHDTPVLVSNGAWEPSANRFGAMYMSVSENIYMEEIFIDHSGWEEGYDFNLSADFPQPPSGLSHNIYWSDDNYNFTMRDCIMSRAASMGVQARGGAVVHDCLFLDNDIGVAAIGGNYQDKGPKGNHSLLNGCVITSAGHKLHASSVNGMNGRPGAKAWGMDFSAAESTVNNSLICHVANPDDPAEIAEKTVSVGPYTTQTPGALAFSDLVVYRWGAGGSRANDMNLEGRNPSLMDTTSIQRYTGTLIGQQYGTIDGFVAEVVANGPKIKPFLHDVLDYFRVGFGMKRNLRTAPDSLTFLPNPACDGFRWDNSMNWSTEDLPQDGDSINLGRAYALFGCQDVNIASMTFNGGELDVTSGRLQIATVTDAADITVRNCGQVDLNATNGGAARASGGRLAFNQAAADWDIYAGGNAELLLGPDMTIPVGKSLTISGGYGLCGWDGTGSPSLTVAGTLAFRPGIKMTTDSGFKQRVATPGRRYTGQTSGATGVIADYFEGSQYIAYNDTLDTYDTVAFLYDMDILPQIGEELLFFVEETRPEKNPTQVFIDHTLIVSAIEKLPAQLQVFRSGRYGLTEPTATPTLVLSSGSSVDIGTVDHWPTGTHYLTGTGITVTDNGANLPAGVTVTGGRLVYTKA